MNAKARNTSEYPQTVVTAVDWLASTLPACVLDLIAAVDEDEVVDLHFELGAYIRSGLGLWGGNRALEADADAWSPVAVSRAVTKALWQRLHSAAAGDRVPEWPMALTLLPEGSRALA